ncbi:uncharacterized protein LOC106753023 [Vigna radiata var. radiata]|uniref:Uncharacterized protein LOC106753023 n=1 Tax=Vigna radiata var. radiata TaxID=3916 RepID=A0A1S3T946_VIGRR|nr:uncharacterized protein LOC106753023 [Vigna radiata var. radiata]
MEETLGQAWDRFKGLLRKTPVHGFDKTTLVLAFLGGLSTQSKMMLDTSARGDIKKKTEDEAYDLIESMAVNEQGTHNERGATIPKRGVLHLPADDALLAQYHLLTQKLNNLTKILTQLPKKIRNVSQAQQLYMQEEAKYMGNQFQYRWGNFNQGNYSQGGKNHPSIRQGQNNPSRQTGGLFNNKPQQQPSLLQQMASLTENVRDLNDKFDKFMKVYDSHFAYHQANFTTLEMQIGQLSKRAETTEKSQFKANTDIGQLSKRVETTEKNQFRANTDVKPKEECKAVVSRSKRRAEKEVIEIESSEEEEDEKEIIELSIKALHQIPVYSKRIKYYLGEVIDLDEEEIEEHEAYTRPKKRKHPTKIKDLGSLTLPCVIGDVDKIGGLVLKPSILSVMVADGSTKWPIGMVEDVIVRVEHLEFLVDFIVMDMDTEERIPVILGRPFMKTAKLVMIIYDGRIMLKDQENVLMYTGSEENIAWKKMRAKYKASRRDDAARGDTGTNDDCNFLQVPKEEDIDKGIQLDLKEATLQPGAKVKYKEKEWLVKELKEKGVMEIERPYSRLVKEVDKRQLMSWSDEGINVGEKT